MTVEEIQKTTKPYASSTSSSSKIFFYSWSNKKFWRKAWKRRKIQLTKMVDFITEHQDLNVKFVRGWATLHDIAIIGLFKKLLFHLKINLLLHPNLNPSLHY
ncbi:uncharacterized protein DS421_4g126010 [Arachis hypogaea]|nr:uncharacterized protein DS421_4g126010 [Arachis hypogaea]